LSPVVEARCRAELVHAKGDLFVGACGDVDRGRTGGFGELDSSY
jgi:hypothetical protein